VRRQLDVIRGIHDTLPNIVLLNASERGFCFALKIGAIEIATFWSDILGRAKAAGH